MLSPFVSSGLKVEQLQAKFFPFFSNFLHLPSFLLARLSFCFQKRDEKISFGEFKVFGFLTASGASTLAQRRDRQSRAWEPLLPGSLLTGLFPSHSWGKPHQETFRTRAKFLLPWRKTGVFRNPHTPRSREAASEFDSVCEKPVPNTGCRNKSAACQAQHKLGMQKNCDFILVWLQSWGDFVQGDWHLPGGNNYKLTISVYKLSFSREGNVKIVLLLPSEKTIAIGHNWHILKKNNAQPNTRHSQLQGFLFEAVIKGLCLISSVRISGGVLLSHGMRRPSPGWCPS